MMNGKPLPMSIIASGVDSLDILTGGFAVGDNVVWEVEAGSSSDAFIRSFVARSFRDAQKVIYVSFNRSPQTVLQGLGASVPADHFTLIDCFTGGKGKNDNTFVKFYEKAPPNLAVKIDDPRDIERFTETLNAIEDKLPPGARYVFDSLTGMQDLWGDENATHRFFTYMCPRLYDLGTVAYWILEKEAHSPRFKANLRHITQVVFDLSKRKNNLFLKALKLEGRQDREVFKPHPFDVRGDVVTIASLKKEPSTDIGARLKDARLQAGLNQKELADRAGFTPSFLSQLESNQVSPSLGTFMQICRALGINPGQFLDTGIQQQEHVPWLIKGDAIRRRPVSREETASVYEVLSGDRFSVRIVTIPPRAALKRHFFYRKEEELVYVVKGALSVVIGESSTRIGPGDVVHLKQSFPSGWKNEGGDEAELLVIW